MSADKEMGTLALTLGHHDGVSIGPDIEVLFVKVISNSQSVRLAIRAPKNVEISRFKRIMEPLSAANKPVDELEETLRLVRAAQ